MNPDTATKSMLNQSQENKTTSSSSVHFQAIAEPDLLNKHSLQSFSFPTIFNLIYFSGYSQLKKEADKCHSVIMVLSPNALNEKWDTSSIVNGVKQLQSLCSKMMCVVLQELPKNDCKGESLKSISQSVDLIVWRRKAVDNKFWLSLRLKLPPRIQRNEPTGRNEANELRLNKMSQNIPGNMV